VHDGEAAGVVQVHHDAALVAMEVGLVEEHAVPPLVARPFHAHDVGAENAEDLRARGAAADGGEIDHGDAAERGCHGREV